MRPTHAGFKIASCAVAFLFGWSAPSYAANWTPLTNPSPTPGGTMMLLTDGTVMVQGHPFKGPIRFRRHTSSADGTTAVDVFHRKVKFPAIAEIPADGTQQSVMKGTIVTGT
jgi:hypothetical protein